MPTKMVRQVQFSTGEVDVTTWKRTDAPEYLTCAQSLLNAEVSTTGLAKKRKGTTFLYNVTPYANLNSHMYDFVDNLGRHYILLSANGYFYVFATQFAGVDIITARGNYVVTSRGNNVIAFGNSMEFVQAIASPYTINDLNQLDYSQDNDAIVFSNSNYPTGRVYISAYNNTAFPTFAFQDLNIYPLPSYDFNTFNYNQYTVTLSVSGDQLTFIMTNPTMADQTGFTEDWIGGQIIGGGASVTDPVGYATITAVANAANVTTFTATIQIPFNTTTPATQGSQYSIRQPAWSATLGYPAKVLYFQNRLWLGNTPALSNTIFGSKINSPINFDVGSGRDTDAIVYTIGQTNSGSILWMNGGKQMEIYCQNYEFSCPQDQNSALTPASFSIRQQSGYGAYPLLKPITYINDSYYVTRTGKAMINFHYNGVGLSYTSSNISAASSHLAKQPSSRALLRGSDTSQDNFIYFLNESDDTLTTFQFAAEAKLAALTPVTFQDNVQLIDICTIDNRVCILKYYNLTQQFTIEIFDESTRIDNQLNAQMAADGTISGLDILNGYTIQVVFQNQDFGQYVVTGGIVTVNNPNMYSGVAQVGLLYDVSIVPMYPLSSPTGSPFKKQVTRIYVDYYESLVFNINNNLVPYQNFNLIQAGAPLTPQTDTAIVAPFYGWNRFDANGVPIISITQSSPFDLQILGIGYQIDEAVI